MNHSTAKEHYDNHLASFYAWMSGDFDQNRKEFQSFLERNKLKPGSTRSALDLGAGHGIQSIALSAIGFSVTAVDFNDALLHSIRSRHNGDSIALVNGDIRDIKRFAHLKPELIVCWGDTITHLDSVQEIEIFIRDCAEILMPNGRLLVSFRDNAEEPEGLRKYIPVRNDDDRILTCILEYEKEKVGVTDLLYERNGNGWELKVSSYKKIRLSVQNLSAIMERNELTVTFSETENGLRQLIAERNSPRQ